jgi:hypothetical protein
MASSSIANTHTTISKSHITASINDIGKTPTRTTLCASPVSSSPKPIRNEIIQDPTLGPTLRKVKSTPSQPQASSSSLGRKTSWLLSKFSHKSRAETPSPPPTASSPAPENKLYRTSSISVATLRDLDHDYTMQTSSISPLDVKKLNPKVGNPSINGAKKPVNTVNSQVPASFIHTPVPQAKLSPETAAGSLSPISSLEEHPMTLNSAASTEPPKSGFLINTLRKLKATTEPTMPLHPQSRRRILNVNKNKPVCPIPDLKKLNVKRVKFSLDTFINDPPQQIPARLPKEGTVKVGEDGSIVRPHHPADLSNPTKSYHTSAYTASVAAYNAATIVANVVRSENKKPMSKSKHTGANSKEEEEEEDIPANLTMNKFKIDTPMHEGGGSNCNSRANSIASEKYSENTRDNGTDANDSASAVRDKKTQVSLAELYTRCCHLREIMPINATLSQLEGQTGTLPYLRFMNPRPTMIEVLAFSDFLSVAKITTVVLNNMDITEDMFRNLILSLAFSKSLFKLSLKNANITPASWKVLCAFLITNKRLMKLDISVAEPRDGKKQIRYKQDKFYDRMNLDWKLLTKTLVARGGIEELIINGCMVPHEQFQELISKGCSIATKRLGVASSDLQESDLLALSEWITQTNCVCEGIDLGGNDLGDLTELIAKIFSQASLFFVSFNSCHLKNAAELGAIFEAHHWNSKLRFIDLSFNPELFPKILPAFTTYLPDYREMRRIHLDYNGLRSKDIIRLADSFAKCPSLSHISLLGNSDINAAAGEALAVAVKLSQTITFVDIDSGLVPENISRRLSHYCMQNAETLVKQKVEKSDVFEDYNFEGELELLDDGTELANAVKYVVDNNDSTKTPLCEPATGDVENKDSDDIASSKLFSDALAKRADIVRTKVRKRLEKIMQNYEHYTEVEPEIREKVIKLYYLDATLESVLSKYNRLKQKFYPRSFGVYYPPTPKDEPGEAEKGLGSGAVSDSAESVEGFSEMTGETAAPGTTAVVQDYVEPTDAGHPANELYKQREREEGDFHKLGVFIRHSKSAQSLTHPLEVSGSQLRQLLLDESGATRSEDIESFINRLRSMDDTKLQEYFRRIYCKPLPAQDDDSDDNDDSDSCNDPQEPSHDLAKVEDATPTLTVNNDKTDA